MIQQARSFQKQNGADSCNGAEKCFIECMNNKEVYRRWNFVEFWSNFCDLRWLSKAQANGKL